MATWRDAHFECDNNVFVGPVVSEDSIKGFRMTILIFITVFFDAQKWAISFVHGTIHIHCHFGYGAAADKTDYEHRLFPEIQAECCVHHAHDAYVFIFGRGWKEQGNRECVNASEHWLLDTFKWTPSNMIIYFMLDFGRCYVYAFSKIEFSVLVVIVIMCDLFGKYKTRVCAWLWVCRVSWRGVVESP